MMRACNEASRHSVSGGTLVRPVHCQHGFSLLAEVRPGTSDST